VLAIKCEDVGGKVGVLASAHNEAGEDVLVTDGSWSCSKEEEEGWTEPGFRESSDNWEAGDVIGKHGVSPWSKIGQISDNANWIWTKNWKAWETVYCRYATPPINTLRATCDNKMTVYVDGVEQEVDGLSNWRKESQIPLPSDFKVLAIKCEDVGGKVGVLASAHNEAGEDVLVTDGSWSCSKEEEEGWTEPGFRESSDNWEAGDVIGKHGVSPWSKIGEISDDANWIWTKNWKAWETVYCRYTNN